MSAPRILPLVSFLLLASLASAQPMIHAIAPSTGPAAGGTEVTLSGSGFAPACGPITCPTPTVIFGGIPALQTRVIDDSTVVAVTPPHLPGTVDVRYVEWTTATRENAFTFTGDVPAAFERILLPIFVPPVRGAFGSEFHTSFRAVATQNPVLVWGLQLDPNRDCAPVSACIDIPAPWQFNPPGPSLRPRDLLYNGTPGRFLFVPREQVDGFSANLRVHDVSRAGLNFGTEIPVVRESDFVRWRMTLLGLPNDPRFRKTLRIYSAKAPFAVVRVDHESVTVPLRPGATIYDPWYAEVTVFPAGLSAGNETFDLTVDAPLPPTMPPAEPVYTPIWAFVTVTNNETQMITTITPQP